MKNIIFDLDGTILENDNTLSSETIDCIKKISKSNIVTLATGRSLIGLPESVLKVADCISFYITSNGTTIFNENKEVIYRDIIRSRDIEEFLKAVNENDNIVVEILSEAKWHVDEIRFVDFKKVDIKPQVMAYIEKTRIKHNTLLDFLFENNTEIEKISLNLCAPVQRENVDLIHNLCNQNGLRFFSDNPHKIDVFKKTTNKGAAIKFLSNYCKIGLDDTISFGNDENDIEMFEVSGYSVLMPQSYKYLKKHVDITLRKNDEKRISRALSILEKKTHCSVINVF